MTTLDLSYPSTPDARPKFLKSLHIEQVALEVRRQLGAESRPRLQLQELAGIDRLRVNRVDYEVWTDIDHVVHDDDGTEVLGVFEFTPASSINAVSISASPVSETRREEVVLSSFAHEFGHGIFDAPHLIVGAHAPSLFDSNAVGVRAFRAVTDTPAHLNGQAATLPDHVRLAEWRANEFMGLLLAPRHLLVECVTAEAARCAVQIKYQPSVCAPSARDFPELVVTEFEAQVSLPEITRAVAAVFGVTAKFIAVRMKKYGLIPAEVIAH